MDPIKLAKQMIDFNKTSFDNTFNALVLLQDHCEKMISTFLEQATWLPEEGRKVLNDWLESYRTGREEFKKKVDESFKKVEAYFSEAAKDEPSRESKP